MKLGVSNQRNHGLTLLEAVVIILSLFILVATLVPALSVARTRPSLSCMNQLKQTGLAFMVWQGDNNGKFPMAVSVIHGGAMESAARGDVAAIFQIMSNELSTPKVLICPADKYHHAATNFGSAFTAKNVSYFAGLDANTNWPQSVLSGDDNFEIGRLHVKSGMLEISSNTPVLWSPDRHRFYGNLLLADGSVQGVSDFTLTNWLRSAVSPALRLAIP